MRNFFVLVAVSLAVVLTGPSALAQDTHGDVFGDLYHVKRDAVTGQPILQKRWIEYPGDVFDWGYCPIPVDALGNEIPFAPLSCEVDPASATAVIEVDYFGRLSMGRTKESNLRMHFDEVISKINEAQIVDRDPSGRLQLGTCDLDGGVVIPLSCTFKLVDSPGENLGMYWRLLRYGHLQTDPLEEDTSPGGDPAAGIVYRPALTADDYAKFQGVMQALLPVPPAQASSCFSGGAFTCDDRQFLDADDFGIAASFLGTAADKTGRMTPDLLQYLHRTLKITQTTALAEATLRTLPALIRDCGDDPDNQIADVTLCTIVDADPELGAPADELFVDYSPVAYERADWFDAALSVLKPFSADTWVRATDVPLLGWLAFINPGLDQGANIDGFVKAGNDAVRSVQFLHEYELPADLGWDFDSIIPENPALVVLGLVADKTPPQAANTTIRLVATAAGGIAPIQYKFMLSDGATTTTLQDWSTANQYTWTPVEANLSYVVSVWARSAGNLVDAPEAINAQAVLPFVIGSALTITSLQAVPPSPQPSGSAVAVTAIATSGIQPYQYRWSLKIGDVWQPLADWGSASTLNWTTPSDGSYTIGVWVRDVAIEVWAEMPFVVASLPPISADDAYATPFETALVVSAPGVLANDNTLEGGVLTATLQSTVAHGTLTLGVDGSFSYVPAAGFYGADTFSYRASNVNGPGNVATVTLDVGEPDGPFGLHAASISGSVVTLDWNPPPGVTVADYILEGGAAPDAVGASYNVGSPTPTLTFTAPTGIYYVRVRALTANGLTPVSNEIMLHVNVPALPAPPYSLTGLAVGSALSLEWHNSFEGGEPTSLVLDVVGPTVLSIPLGLVDTFNYADVPPGTYTLSLRALNATGSSEPSNAVTLTFPAVCSAVPQTPTNFVAYKTGNVITAAWDPPAAGGAPTAYVLNVVGSVVGSYSTTAHTVSSEVDAGTYGLTVTAVNACGSSAPSPLITVTVP